MKLSNRDRFDWCAVVGGLLVSALLAALLFVALTSWEEFKTFLSVSASGWIQAFGSIATIICGFVYIERANKAQEDRDRLTMQELHKRQFLAVLEACYQFEEVVAWASIGSIEGPNDNAALELATSEALEAFKSISLSEIPDAQLLQYCGLLRKHLVTLLIHCRAADAKPGIKSHEHLAEFMPLLTGHLSAATNRAMNLLKSGSTHGIT